MILFLLSLHHFTSYLATQLTNRVEAGIWLRVTYTWGSKHFWLEEPGSSFEISVGNHQCYPWACLLETRWSFCGVVCVSDSCRVFLTFSVMQSFLWFWFLAAKFETTQGRVPVWDPVVRHRTYTMFTLDWILHPCLKLNATLIMSFLKPNQIRVYINLIRHHCVLHLT